MQRIEFAPQWSDLESDKPQFHGVAYSGGLIPSFGQHGDSAIDLAGFDEAQVITLANHSSDVKDIVGTCKIWRSDDQQLLIQGELTKATESGRSIAALLADGIVIPMSVGIIANPEVGRKGRMAVVNQRELHPKTIFRSPRFREVSFVPVGADPQAYGVQCAASEEKSMSDELETLLADAKTKLAAAEQRAIAAEAKVSDLEKSISSLRAGLRKTAVEELHAQLNKPVTETALAMYQSLTDEQFSAIRTELLSFKSAKAETPVQATPQTFADPLQAQAAARPQTPATASMATLFEMAYNKQVF